MTLSNYLELHLFNIKFLIHFFMTNNNFHSRHSHHLHLIYKFNSIYLKKNLNLFQKYLEGRTTLHNNVIFSFFSFFFLSGKEMNSYKNKLLLIQC